METDNKKFDFLLIFKICIIHPGEVLKEKIEYRGISQHKLANHSMGFIFCSQRNTKSRLSPFLRPQFAHLTVLSSISFLQNDNHL